LAINTRLNMAFSGHPVANSRGPLSRHATVSPDRQARLREKPSVKLDG